MKKIAVFFFLLMFLAGFGYLADKTGLVNLIIQTYKSFASKNSSAPIHSNTISRKQKAEIDLQFQHQYQKMLHQQEFRQEPSSDEEKLEMLNDALTELDHAEDEYDREVAVMTLGELDGPLVMQGLLTALHDHSSIVVTQAIRQINKWPNSLERTEMLLKVLQHPNDEIVLDTLTAINIVDNQKLVERLKELSKHHNPEIRDAANLALNLAE